MEKFLTFIREHVRKIVGGLPWNKMAANTQKDASINPEVIAAIMAWIVDTRLYLFYDRELQHFGMEPRSCMMERVLDDVRRAGYSKLMLWVFDSNVRAIRFYEANGFAASGKKRPALGAVEEMYIKEM